MSKRVLVTHPLSEAALEPLSSLCDLQVLSTDLPLRDLSKVRSLGACHGLLCLLTDGIDKRLLAALPELEFVSSVSVGVDHIDISQATSLGIAVGHTPGVLVDATADTAFALLLAAARRVAEADRFVRAGKWQAGNRWSPDFFLGKDVSGATLGIVGLGQIGQAVAKRASAFGMQVVAWTPSGREIDGVQPVQLDALLRQSDFVSVHVALNEDTRNLLDAERIAAMKQGAVLVNTARGGIIDEAVVARALDNGHLFAAGFDVFACEPVEHDNPLLNHPAVVLTPHVGSATARTRADMVALAVDNAVAAVRGERMPHCANPQVYGRP